MDAAARGLRRTLGPERRRGLRLALTGARTLVTGRPSRSGWERTAVPPGAGGAPGAWPLSPEPVDPDSWPSPPPLPPLIGREGTGTAPDAPRSYDLALFRELVEQYRPTPVLRREQAPSYAAADLSTAARKRVRWVHDTIDLRDKDVLEIGCGSGLETWFAGHGPARSATGVDLVEWTAWRHLADERVRYLSADLARPGADGPALEPRSFDRIMSFTVWEHVSHPHAMLRSAFEALRPGGLVFLRANLFLGPKASHRYRDIPFPWPHLLFQDDVIAEWSASVGLPARGAAWVNRLTMAQYREHFARVGFEVLRTTYTRTPVDEPFYARFEDVLGRYPRWDLGTDFFLVVLRRPPA